MQHVAASAAAEVAARRHGAPGTGRQNLHRNSAASPSPCASPSHPVSRHREGNVEPLLPGQRDPVALRAQRGDHCLHHRTMRCSRPSCRTLSAVSRCGAIRGTFIVRVPLGCLTSPRRSGMIDRTANQSPRKAPSISLSRQSFNAALKDRVVEAGHEVEVSDLYAMGFDPIAKAQDFGNGRARIIWSTPWSSGMATRRSPWQPTFWPRSSGSSAPI